MNQLLQEYVDSRGQSIAIDRAAGVIRGVKVLGLHSRNGRTYLPEALANAIGLYEGAKVNVNHGRVAPSAPRDYQDRLGAIRSVRLDPAQGLFGDLHFNPKHHLAEQLLWDAEHAPENVGLSHNVEARTSLKDGRTIVEAIAVVYSVDLVADPATTRGLFEEADCSAGHCGGEHWTPGWATSESAASRGLAPAPSRAATDGNKREPFSPAEKRGWSELTAAALRRQRPDLVEELLSEERGERRLLLAEIDRLQTAAALSLRQQLILRLLAEHGLPVVEAGGQNPLVSGRFLESLLAAPDESTVRELIAERALLVRQARQSPPFLLPGTGQPRSCDQLLVERRPSQMTSEEFVRAIT
jgi:hypothetical protein